MISKKDLKDWLDENSRKEYAKKLEEKFDKEIKKNALNGETTFLISTGRANNSARMPEKTGFYDLWNEKGLSEVNRNKVKEDVLNEYKNHGFSVEIIREDCGWHSSYEAVRFNKIDKALEGDNE